MATLRDSRIGHERVGVRGTEKDLVLALIKIGLHPRKKELVEAKGAEFEKN